VITLNTDSEVRVRMDRDVRRIWLDRGQAFFSVTPDHARPFEVFANDGVVRAVGTSFDVALGREPGTVKVTVVEGSVEILPRVESAATASIERVASKLVHGQSATYRSGGAVERVTSSGLASALAWRDGKMDFDNQRLVDALAEHNRYTNKKIVLGDDTLKELRISGTLRIGDTQGFLFLLKESLGLTVLEQPEMFILLSSSGSLNASSPGQHPGGV
jgi:transmembrane sensor